MQWWTWTWTEPTSGWQCENEPPCANDEEYEAETKVRGLEEYNDNDANGLHKKCRDVAYCYAVRGDLSGECQFLGWRSAALYSWTSQVGG
jgi:hypothetical protein